MISSSFLSDIFVNILANLVSSIVLLAVGFIAGRWWDYSRKGRAFRRMFGTRAGKKEDLFIVLDTLRDTRMLSGTEQQKLGLTSQGSTTQRFYKIFPDGHLTAISGPREAVVPDCSARASAYLIDALRGIRGISTKTVSD